MKARVFCDFEIRRPGSSRQGHGHALNRLSSVGEVRQGKVIDLDLAETDAAKAKSIAEGHVWKPANTVIEKYEMRIRIGSSACSRPLGSSSFRSCCWRHCAHSSANPIAIVRPSRRKSWGHWLRNDPHIAKAMKFLQVSNSRADVLKQADSVIDVSDLSEQHEHPGQNALFWNAFRKSARRRGWPDDLPPRFTDDGADRFLLQRHRTCFRERESDRQELDLASAWSRQVPPRVLERVRAKLNSGKGKAP